MRDVPRHPPALVSVGLVPGRWRPLDRPEPSDRAVLRALRRSAPDLGHLVVPVVDASDQCPERLVVFVHGPGLEVCRAVAACADAGAGTGMVVEPADVTCGEGAVESLFRLCAGLTDPLTGRPGTGDTRRCLAVVQAHRSAVRLGCTDPVLDHFVHAAVSFALQLRTRGTQRPSTPSRLAPVTHLEVLTCAS